MTARTDQLLTTFWRESETVMQLAKRLQSRVENLTPDTCPLRARNQCPMSYCKFRDATCPPPSRRP